MLKTPASKYRPLKPFGKGIRLDGRRWPDQPVTRAPVWMSTDLRDGNQALFEPMDTERKLRMFRMLVEIGFKEIEIGFPSASETDFDFVRELIDGGHIPPDVTIEVLTQAREHLIDRTFEAVRGAPRVIVHYYNACAENFRRIVFCQDQAGVRRLAVEGAQMVQARAAKSSGTEFVFQYSPEVFSGAELPFVRDVVDAVTEVWQATAERPCIINLPATVEMSTPNVYADQIEWMHCNLARREGIVLSVHPHNDRGTAVAAAEMALMAGADRVEGCLFGHGERTGNVDLVTLALNLYSQGVDPELDFSRLSEVARTVEHCTRLPIHPRHPYVGDLVFTAFSGSHQDAIRKGFAAQQAQAPWEVPYLAVDPADIGRSYDSIIRVNSQSGKGGIAYLLESEYGMVLPRRLQVEFSAVVQKLADDCGKEVSAAEIWSVFRREYLETHAPLAYLEHHLFEQGELQGVQLTVRDRGRQRALRGLGNGPIDAAVNALDCGLRVLDYEERAIGNGSDARAVAFVELTAQGMRGALHGVGIHANIVTASIHAILSAANRVARRQPLSLGVHAESA